LADADSTFEEVSVSKKKDKKQGDKKSKKSKKK
jgi:hypothetical protein